MVGAMNNTINTTINQPGLQTTQTDTPPGVTPTGSQGVSGPGGPVPDPQGGAVNLGGNIAMLQSILALMPSISSEDEDVLLAEIETKMKETLSRTDVESIKNKQNEKLTMIQQKAAQDEESAKKMQEAIDQQKNASIWDKIKLAFQVLAAVIAVVVAVVAIATGVGAPLGALLIAGALVAIVMATDAVVTEATPDHLGIAGSIKLATDHSNKSHADKVKDAATADQDFGYVMMAVGAAVAIASIAAAPTELFDVATDAANTALRAGDVTSSVTDAVGGGVGIGAAVVSYQASEDQVDAMKDQSKGTFIKASMKQVDEFIDMLIQQLEGVQDVFNGSINALVEAAEDKNKTAMHSNAV